MSKLMFGSTFSYKIIYVFRIPYETHRGLLKIGETTLESHLTPKELPDNSKQLLEAAIRRNKIDSNRLGVPTEIVYTTLAIDKHNKTFRDTDVHKILKNSGIEKYNFDNETNPQEWFSTNIETVKNAINAAKENRKSLLRTEVKTISEEIIFRPEQQKAIEKTLKRFKVTNKMLWNAKMRFGKTLSALEVTRRMSEDEVFSLSNAIILTHRPVVDKGWFEDFTKIFTNNSDFLYGSRERSSIKELKKLNKKYIYFASLQDLRDSSIIGGNYSKNEEIFGTDWDLIIIDEAHEGTQTELGQKVIDELLKSDKDHNTKQLHLSGTPFNLITEFEQDDIFTWDYIMEQKAKQEWEVNNPLLPNPYADLPRLNIYTYNLKDYLPDYQDVADKAFNFREFFRVWTGETEKDGVELNDKSKIGRFIHEQDVKKFLELIRTENENNNFPFSKVLYRENFRHSFWILPGVKEAKALKDLMLSDPVLSMFDIVNVAGTGDNNGLEALDAVYEAIGKQPEEKYTITLSCGKLTTGVTVREWSTVLYLAGSFSTSASSYLQTIFRVQSPGSYGGKQKTDCYVFDFAPDRTLKMIAQAGQLSTRAGSTNNQETMRQFLNFCPVISVSGSEMKKYDVSTMLQELKKAYIERVVENGFDDVKIYNDNLYKLDENALEKFKELKGIIGSTKQSVKINEIQINQQGFTNEEWEKVEKIEKKNKKELTEEEKNILKELREKKKQKADAISILRGISIRIPLLIYGAEITEDTEITTENFTELIDDISWEEFMPKGVSKEMFNSFSQYYDNEIFIGAGRRIRNISKHADTLSPIERAKTIAELFATFRNPDKETVLTPWKTVNRHLGDTIGGYNFFDKEYLVSIEEPRYINQGDVTYNVLIDTNSKILELNSKTGLYPLYVTISLYKQKCINVDPKKLTNELEEAIWNQTVKDNIYVICRTKMARSITKRTLLGYKDVSNNILSVENIINLLDNNLELFQSKVLNPKTWNREGELNMKFNAIIGNPPYNIIDGGGGSSSKPIYNKFVEAAISLTPDYISMIMPSRWFTGGKGLDNFRKQMINDKRIRVLHDYSDSKECFNNVNIEGGVSYFLWDNNTEGKCKFFSHLADGTVNEQERYLSESDKIDVVIRDEKSISILKKVLDKKEQSFSIKVYPRNPFKVTKDYEKYFSKVKTNTRILTRIDNVRQYRYLADSYKIMSGNDLINKYKIFMSKADGAAGQVGNPIPAKIIGNPEYGMPEDICTETFLAIGPFENKEEMFNVATYLKTKFARYLIGIRKNKNMTMDTYKFLPIQDFTKDSKINWNGKLNEIDEELFRKYNFSNEEIVHVNEYIMDL